jgi:DNA-binding NtrC family response regulator
VTLPPPRILVVDDEPSVLELLVEILQLDGHEVDTAADGAEALLLVGSRCYAAVLSDVVMPTLDGVELYRAVKDRQPELAARMVFMAARIDAVDQLREAGLRVLAKPFDVEEVRRVVRELVEE